MGCSLATGCAWDKLPFRCSNPALSATYTNVERYSGALACGNLMLESDIGGGLNDAPFVVASQPGPRDTAYYALMMVDPDADMDGSFPDAAAPGGHAPVRHWVVGNIAAADLAAGNLTGALTVSPFHGPSPPVGSHRYTRQSIEPRVASLAASVGIFAQVRHLSVCAADSNADLVRRVQRDGGHHAVGLCRVGTPSYRY
jgi:phosphatidylethanolamine-binding protein (PEBP) family uncharacterized protein